MGHRFFLTRGASPKRKLINEEKILPVLESYGFTIINNSTLPFSQQIALFHQATVVLGVHGSNLANILFCRPGAKVLEIRHAAMDSYLSDCYYKLSVTNGFSYNVYFDFTKTTDKDPDIYVDPLQLDQFLKMVLGNGKQ
jgi:capsular polysaccharide biosynthesis protein